MKIQKFILIDYLKRLKTKFTPLAHYYSLLGIGIGAPNANYYKGTVEQPPNLNWGFVNGCGNC